MLTRRKVQDAEARGAGEDRVLRIAEGRQQGPDVGGHGEVDHRRDEREAEAPHQGKQERHEDRRRRHR